MIKKMIKGEKGFTLVELLAVIVILGIIVAIAIPAIGNVISTAKDNATKAEETLVLDAARLYEIQEGEIPAGGVEVSELITKGYLDERQGDGLAGTVTKDATTGKLSVTLTSGLPD